MGTDHTIKALRLVQMRDMFLAGGEYTVAELAETFGVHKRTIERDMHALNKLGVPVRLYDGWKYRMTGRAG